MKKPKKNKPQPSAKAAAPQSESAQPSASGVTSAPASAPEIEIADVGGEPTASRNAVPVLFVALLGLMIFFADMFIVEHGGNLDAKVYQPYADLAEVTRLNPIDPVQQQLQRGQLVFAKICAPCHQNDGNGSASQNAPPLVGSEWVLANDPSRIIRIVLHGLQGPITVKGREWGQGAMFAWGSVLNDEEIALVLSYVRNSWGNKAPTVTADQVKKARVETKDWSGYMSVEELNKVQLKN